jgi:flagellar assembly factor FliW
MSSDPTVMHKAVSAISPQGAEREICFAQGLLGFPHCRRYKLKPFDPGNGDVSPFFILESLDQELSFPVIGPHSLLLDYNLPVGESIMATLRAKSPDQLSVLLIVTVRDRLEDITVNLCGPLVVNPNFGLGIQLVEERFPIRHPLLQRFAP